MNCRPRITDEATIRKDISDAVNDWMGITLTDAQVDEILADENLGYDCRQFGIDTVVRENIGQFLAKKITGRAWPLGGDTQEAKDEFFRLYEQNAEAKGFTLHSDGSVRRDTPRKDRT